MSRATIYPDTREHILAVGQSLIQSRGFTALGLAELLSQAGVPKGSFYHYFASKEAFGVALLERYFDEYDNSLDAQLSPANGGTGRERLLTFFGAWLERARSNNAQCQCLVVKLAGEVCDLSEPMREALNQGVKRVNRRIAQGIRAAVEDSSLAPVDNADALAHSLYSAWIGSALLAKVSRTVCGLEHLLEQTARQLTVPGQCNAASTD
jgi:TetR/AcrR family transcriptional repressor of nem operon